MPARSALLGLGLRRDQPTRRRPRVGWIGMRDVTLHARWRPYAGRRIGRLSRRDTEKKLHGPCQNIAGLRNLLKTLERRVSAMQLLRGPVQEEGDRRLLEESREVSPPHALFSERSRCAVRLQVFDEGT